MHKSNFPKTVVLPQQEESHAENVFVLHCIPVQKNKAMLAVTCAAPFTTRDRNARIYMRSFVHKSCSLFM